MEGGGTPPVLQRDKKPVLIGLNFEPFFIGIHKVLREIWLFEHKIQARNFGGY